MKTHEEGGTPLTGSAAFGMDPTIQLTECKPYELKYWWEFSMWWQPRNTGTPSPADAQTWEQYQYYCAGRLDERTAVPPNAPRSATEGQK